MPKPPPLPGSARDLGREAFQYSQAPGRLWPLAALGLFPAGATLTGARPRGGSAPFPPPKKERPSEAGKMAVCFLLLPLERSLVLLHKGPGKLGRGLISSEQSANWIKAAGLYSNPREQHYADPLRPPPKRVDEGFAEEETVCSRGKHVVHCGGRCKRKSEGPGPLRGSNTSLDALPSALRSPGLASVLPPASAREGLLLARKVGQATPG